jgi:phosphoserine phosphatase
MTHVATFVCDPEQPALDDALLAAASSRLRGVQTAWLAPGVAADIFFEPADEDLAAITAALLAGRPVDVMIQPVAGRRKKLLLADMDSTLIEQESVHELANFIGKTSEIAAAAERAVRGEVAVAPALRAGVAHFAGVPVSVFDRILAERIRVARGAAALVKTMRDHGAYTALVSNSFTHFAEPVAAQLGFDMSVANRLLAEDDRLTGEVAEPVQDGTSKRMTLLALRRRLGLMPDETLAVGDGANDVEMLTEAGLGVGYRPKPALASKIAHRLDHADLTALLYAQGFRREEFSV